MRTVCPVVAALNQRSSSEMCHGIVPSRPITRLRAMAAMALSWGGWLMGSNYTATGALMAGCGS